jgi:NAD(P)-dependent dehydrogenase (short-subunit alcohol dehydrogenase family)
MKRLQDKVVLVTGASSGLGAATAVLMAAEGAKVAVAARRADRGEALVAQIEATGGEGLFVQTDVTRTGDVEAMVAATLARFGRLDGAVNNAGITGPVMKLMAEITEDEWDMTLDCNLKAVFMCMKFEIPAMLAGGGGAIVNMSSMYGLKPSDLSHAPYCASKYGVVGLSQTAAIDYADQGIRVNAVCPAFIHSEMVDPYVENAPDLMRAVIARHSAMNPLGEADEVAQAICWLISDAASFISGAALPIGGGETTRLY